MEPTKLLLMIIWLSWYGVRSEDFLAQFQAEIDQLPIDLDTLILHIDRNLNPKSEASTIIEPIKLCVPSSEQYLEFWSIVNNFDENLDNPSVSIVQSTNCNENDEIDKLKLWILQIKNDFFELLKKPAWSNEYIDLKVSYENKLTRYSKSVDEVAKKVSSDNGKTVISTLRSEYKLLEAKIMSFFNKVQKQKRAENEKSAQRCVAELIANRIDNALKIFHDIAEERLARQIIVMAFQSVDLFQRLFDFIQLLGDSSATQYAYQGLFLKMASKGQWNDINSLVFLSGIEKHKGSEFKDMSNSLRKKLKPFFAAADYADFFSAVNSRISKTNDFGRDIMPTFVHGAYNSDVGNVMKMLDMQNKFNYMRHKLYLIDSLITEMNIEDHTNKPEFLMVLSDLMDLKAKVSKESTNENDKKIVKQVYENVPNNLVALINPNLCIQNAKTSEFMHALADVPTNSRRHIVTSTEFDETFNFGVEFIDRGRALIFKNIRFGEYLYAIDGDGGARTLTLKAGDVKNDKWANFNIEVKDSMNVRIKNVQTDEFLFATESTDDNGSLVQLESNASESGLWKLVSCSDVK